MTRVSRTPFALLVATFLTFRLCVAAAGADFRPPAVPLVTYNPFLSIWCEADRLNDATTKHWTHQDHSLVSLIRIDGKTYRLMGAEPKNAPAFAQKSVEVLPTRSIYEFEEAGVHVTMTFLQPALPDDLDVYSWPLSYITWKVRAGDGDEHKIELYDSTSSQLAVNKTTEPVEWSRATAGDLTLLRVGTRSQNVLGSCGDDHRVNWGCAYTAAPSGLSQAAIGTGAMLEKTFVEKGSLPEADDPRMPRPADDAQPVMAFAFSLGSVGAEAVQRQVIVAYDEIFAIKYFGKKLLPYWARNGVKIAELLQTASQDYAKIVARCEAFDKELMADMTKVGGEKYAKITALSYRECVAANGLAADANKQPLFFTKENTSNGDIATVDVFFPMDPIWVFLSPSLAKASLVHVLMYSASPHWKFPNAPHDLGTYPLVTGRDDGGEGMPVEESGNMLILCDAIAHAEGNADFVGPWWPQLTQWAKYLEKYGLDPEEQLCTDDFMGHLAHNANLSVKAILGLAAYGDLCRMRGDKETADKYFALAKADARHWMKVAAEGDHYRLAFDKPRTWSQKYNLVWDRILGLNVFPPSVAEKEVAHYKNVMLRYGVPLDSRTHLTKTDWSFWSATLAEKQADFEAIIAPIYDYLNETTARDPVADSYVTDDIRSGGMHARPVVGAFFIKMLSDPAIWAKWASRDKFKPANWAPLPALPKVTMIVPTEQIWRYTTKKPSDDWMKADFDATRWKQGRAGFGTLPPGFVRHTEWTTDDIWLRREITVPKGKHPNLQFVAYHDEDIEIYVNGILAATEAGFTTSYVPLEISGEAKAEMKPGAKILVAVHCHQTEGGQGIDVGLADVTE
ncbi:MAG: glutaminase domain-containing protein [Thermoguttaceae bacterium]